MQTSKATTAASTGDAAVMQSKSAPMAVDSDLASQPSSARATAAAASAPDSPASDADDTIVDLSDAALGLDTSSGNTDDEAAKASAGAQAKAALDMTAGSREKAARPLTTSPGASPAKASAGAQAKAALDKTAGSREKAGAASLPPSAKKASRVGSLL